MPSNEFADEIIAAGGVVIDRTSPDAPRVLLVHRPKYDDWSFPKGKAEGPESLEETALREVREETGLSCRIAELLGTVRYRYRNAKGITRPKVVHYFLMYPVGGRLEVPGEEIDVAEWYDAAEASRMLDHQHDRELLELALRPAV